MADLKDLKSPGAPIARKAPSTPHSVAPSKMPVQRNRQRKSSASVASQSASRRKSSTSSQNLSQTGSKRKPNMEEAPNPHAPHGNGIDNSLTTTLSMSTPKKQKLDAESPSYTTSIMQGESGPLISTQQPTAQPVQAMQPPNFSTASPLEMANYLLTRALHLKPYLVPSAPLAMAINSDHINEIAHAMWQIAFSSGRLLEQVCHNCSMFPHMTLRILANLNYLPSWWYLRDLGVKVMRARSWIIDDQIMERDWFNMMAWCRRNIPAPALAPALAPAPVQLDCNEATKEKEIIDLASPKKTVNGAKNP